MKFKAPAIYTKNVTLGEKTLRSHLNDNSLLSKYQVGFRPKNSSLTALLQVCDEWYTNIDKGNLIRFNKSQYIGQQIRNTVRNL